jgi:hypothetical protein
MPLLCGYDWNDVDWWYISPEDFEQYTPMRGKRCCSCKTMIRHGDSAGRFERGRYPNNDIEDRIYGSEVPLAAWWMCERCAGLFFSLEDLGYSITLPDNMVTLAKMRTIDEE